MLKKILLIISASLLLTAGAWAQDKDKPASPTATAAATDKPARAPIFSPTKAQIKQVQEILKARKLYGGDPSGKYDDDTRAGIRSFQKGNGLRETGTLNRATLEKFGVPLTDRQKEIPVSPNSFADSPASSKPSKTSKSSSKSSTSTGDTPKKTIFRATVDQIKSAQKMMKAKSMYAGEETGKLDDDTRAGLKKFQDANGLKATGTLNAVTLQKMGIPLTDKQKAEASE